MKRLFYVFLGLLLLACSKERTEEVNEYEMCEPTFVEVDNAKADVQTGLIEFDIIPDKNYGSKSTNKGAVLTSEDRIWDKGIIPYYFQGTVKTDQGQFLGWDKEEHKNIMRAAIDDLEAQTGLIIPEYESREALLKEHKDGVAIGVGFASNSAYKGRQGGIQAVKITFGLNPAHIKHEFLHTAGFGHEFQRSDRDQYVEVMYDNMHEHWHRQFDIDPLTVDCGQFDINSIMMYGSYTVYGIQEDGEEKVPTLLTVEGDTIAAPTDLSIGDIKTVQALYKGEFELRD